MATLTASLIVAIICTILGFIAGIHIGIEGIQSFCGFNDDYRIPELRLKRCNIGTEVFNVTYFEIKNQREIQKHIQKYNNLIMQINQFQRLVEEIVGHVIGYELIWFENGRFDNIIQSEIDAFVNNLEQYNRFLTQPSVVVKSGVDKALIELEEANRPIIEKTKKLRINVIDYIEKGGYKLIEFNQ